MISFFWGGDEWLNCVCEREDGRMLDLFKNMKKMDDS